LKSGYTIEELIENLKKITNTEINNNN